MSPQEGGDEVAVAPVGASGSPDNTPQASPLKVQKVQKKESVREQGLSHHGSPPPNREVGPGEGSPEAEIKEEEKSVLSDDDDEDESEPEILSQNESDENSRGGEQIEAPLGSCQHHEWSEWYSQCQMWSEEWDSLQIIVKMMTGLKASKM